MEGAPSANFSLQPETSAVQLDEALAEGQTQPRPVLSARDLHELVEYRLAVVVWNTRASVLNRQHKLVTNSPPVKVTEPPSGVNFTALDNRL